MRWAGQGPLGLHPSPPTPPARPQASTSRVLRSGSPRVHLSDEAPRGLSQNCEGFCITLDEAQRRSGGQPRKVVPDEYLAVAAGPRPNADGGDRQDLGNAPRHLPQHRPDCPLYAVGPLKQPPGGPARLALNDAREVEGGLRGEPEVANHRHAHFHQRAHSAQYARPPALQFHRVRARPQEGRAVAARRIFHARVAPSSPRGSHRSSEPSSQASRRRGSSLPPLRSGAPPRRSRCQSPSRSPRPKPPLRQGPAESPP